MDDERRLKEKRSEQEQRQFGLTVDKLDLKFDSLADKVSALEVSQGGANRQEILDLQSQASTH